MGVQVMKKLFSLFTIVLTLLITFVKINSTNIIASDSISLTAIADTHVVAADNADNNYGRTPQMIIRSRASKDKNYHEGYLMFTVPADVSYLTSAILTLTYNTVPSNAVGRSYYIYTTDANWIEGLGNATGVETEVIDNRITYNNVPSRNPVDNYTTFTIEGTLPAKGDTIDIDVKDIANEYLNVNSTAGEETAISFNIVSAQTVNELELSFRTKENTNGGTPTLVITYGASSEGDIINDEITSLETMAQLNFGMEYSEVNSMVETTLQSNVTVNEYMNNESENYADRFGADLSVFNVTYAYNNASNYPYINKNGFVKLYCNLDNGEGNVLIINLIDVEKKITNIEFIATDGGENLVVTNSQGEVISLTQNNTTFCGEVNDYMFSIQNKYTTDTTTKVNPNVYNIKITYEGKAIEYSEFNNVDMRFYAKIPTEFISYVESFGFDLIVGEKTTNIPVSNYTEESDGNSFAIIIENIKSYDIEITATAYVIVEGEKVSLQSKTYSVLTIIDKYINDAENLELTSSQVDALGAFKEMHSN